jgi:hypothetical protein
MRNPLRLSLRGDGMRPNFRGSFHRVTISTWAKTFPMSGMSGRSPAVSCGIDSSVDSLLYRVLGFLCVREKRFKVNLIAVDLRRCTVRYYIIG